MAATIAIMTVISEVVYPLSTAFKLLVVSLNSSINDIDASPFASRTVEDVVVCTVLCVGDPRNSPWCVLLGQILKSIDNLIMFNIFNLECSQKRAL